MFLIITLDDNGVIHRTVVAHVTDENHMYKTTIPLSGRAFRFCAQSLKVLCPALVLVSSTSCLWFEIDKDKVWGGEEGGDITFSQH